MSGRGPGPDRDVVSQQHAILPWRTVARNIGYGPELARMPKPMREKRVQEFVNLVGLTGFEHRYPHRLSGDMNTREPERFPIRCEQYRAKALPAFADNL